MAMDALALITYSDLYLHLFVCRNQRSEIQFTECIERDRAAYFLTTAQKCMQHLVVAGIEFINYLSGTTKSVDAAPNAYRQYYDCCRHLGQYASR